MIEIAHLAMTNWHSFNVEDIPLSGHASVLGENASGKSTVLDMIQTVLAGASSRYMRLNAVAGEGGKGTSSKRSVRDYCLGAYGEGEFRREGCMTWLSIGFRDTRGIKEDLTIGLALEARKTMPSETVYGRFVVRGRILTTADFLREREGVSHFAQWEEVRHALAGEFGPNFVNHRDSASDYVREYMRDLVPNQAPTQAGAVALTKAVVNGMTLNQGLSATDFVRRYILEDAPMKVADLRESIKTYQQVNQTIKDMRERAARLKVVKSRAEEYRTNLMTRDDEAWIAKKAKYLHASSAMRAIEEEIREAQERVAAEDESIEDLRQARAEAQQDVTRLTNRIAGLKATAGVDSLKATLESNTEHARIVTAHMAMKIDEVGRVAKIANARDPSDAEASEAVKVADRLAKAVALGDQEAAGAAEARFIELMAVLEPRLDATRAEFDADTRKAQEERERLAQAVASAEGGGGGSHLGEETRELMRLLRVAGMAPRALCDIVEIHDAEWVQAAEGLLGRDREAIFVDRSQMAEATAVLKQNRRRVRRASLVSLGKLEAYAGPAESGTFPCVFTSDDKDALAFLNRRYGGVRLAQTIAEFERPGRALMPDGLYDDGLVRNTRFEEQSRLMIGKAAQARLLAESKARIEELDDDLVSLASDKKVISQALAGIGAIRSRAVAGSEFVADWMTFKEQWEGNAEKARAQLEGIDMSEIANLQQKLKSQQAYVGDRNTEIDGITSRLGGYKERIDNGKRLLESLSSREGSRHFRNVAKRLFKEIAMTAAANRPYRQRLGEKAPYELASERYSALASSHRKIEEVARDASEKAAGRMEVADRSVRAAMRSYFDVAPLSSEVGVESSILSEILPWAEQMIIDIEENELTRHEALAAEASARVSSMFRGEFVNALHSRISKLDRDMEALNRSLRSHTFHGERYSFRKSQVASYTPILKAVEIYMTSEDALELLFKGEIPDDSPHKPVLDEVKRILEEPETRFEDFEDYRNFFVFEIHMENLETGLKTRWETRRATGSGAEQQVPLYVAIGASLAAVYGTAEGRTGTRNGMAPAIFDEVFAKLDGKNQRQMMSFYEELGLQVIVAAPPEKRAALMGYMHTVVEIDRIGGGQSMATVVSVKDRARREFQKINPELLDVEEIRALAAAAE